MRRSTSRFLTAVSMIVLILASVAWVRSISCVDCVEFAVASRRVAIESAAHRLRLLGALSLESSPTLAGRIGRDDAPSPGLNHLLPSYEQTLFTRSLTIPYWVIVLPASVLPLLAIVRGKRRPPYHRRYRNQSFRRA